MYSVYNMPLQLHLPLYTLYRYSLLCESIDDMSSSAIRLRSVMGLPPKDLGLKNDEESGESELAPAHSDSPGTCIHVHVQ